MAPFRILCLHGQGVNAGIFSAQTAGLRSLLPSHFEFVFLDGSDACEAAPGVPAIYPEGPFLCWYSSPTVKKVEAAQSLIREYVREIGGVDGVMGFSQGAALAASMILHDEIAGRTPIFRMAIFICSPVPFSYSLQYGIDTRTYFGLQADAPIRPGCPCKVPEYLITDKAYLQGEEGEDDVSATYYQMFHPTVDTVRINIPTAHIYGRKDPWRRHSLDLVRLCRKEGTSVYEHSSGHVIPKQDDEEEEMCNVIETAMASIAAV